jgi:hypothetical protein
MRVNEAKIGTEELDRRLRFKVVQFRLGNCINCASPRADSKYLRHCKDCGDTFKKRRRKKRGQGAWKKGSRGRPPLWFTSKIAEE